MIKYIAIDLGGVYFKWSSASVFRKLSRLTETNIEVVRKAWVSRRGDFETGILTVEDYWKNFCEVIGKAVPYKELRAIEIDENMPNARLIHFLDILRQRYKVCVITNISDTLDTLDRKFDFVKKFEFVLDSYHAGVQKPDKRFWDILLKMTGCSPSEIVVIDDSETVIRAARDRGFISLQYRGMASLKRDLKDLKLI